MSQAKLRPPSRQFSRTRDAWQSGWEQWQRLCRHTLKDTGVRLFAYFPCRRSKRSDSHRFRLPAAHRLRCSGKFTDKTDFSRVFRWYRHSTFLRVKFICKWCLSCEVAWQSSAAAPAPAAAAAAATAQGSWLTHGSAMQQVCANGMTHIGAHTFFRAAINPSSDP